MSISACAGLVCTGLKKHYSNFNSFLMLCIPKTIFSLIRYYFENFESNYFLLIILLLSMMIFDVLMLFVVFDCPQIQKILYIAMMDIIFMPVLLVKQALESKYLTEQNTLEFKNFSQLLTTLICYSVLFAVMIILVHLLGKIINKTNFTKPIFDIFSILALFGYLSTELIAAVMYWQNLVGRTNQFIQYFNCALIYCVTLLIMYLISTYITKKRLMREVNILNSEKDRQYEYYNLMKKHNQEIRKIRHDLNGHFSVLDSLVKDKQYDRLEEYISNLSDKYKQIKNIVYTSNLTADAVISSIAEKCERNNIKFIFKGTLPDKCFIDDISLTCIFLNILNNAFEACEKVTDEKFIKLIVLYKKECIVIECQNSKIPTPKKHDLFATSKQSSEHGFGIKIIKDVVSNYNGIVNFVDNINEFEVSLLIPAQENEKR